MTARWRDFVAAGDWRGRTWHKMTMAHDPQSGADPGFGIYVHWPFCLSKCPYCDFNSHVRQGALDEARFVAAFARELAHRAALTPGREVASIFFGGGTPSLMRASTVGAILDAIARSLEHCERGRKSRSKPIRPASRRNVFEAIAPPASTAFRSACRP